MMRPTNCHLYRSRSTDTVIDGRINLTEVCHHADRRLSESVWLLHHYGIALGDAIAFSCYELDREAAIFFTPIPLTPVQESRIGWLAERKRGDK